MSKSACPDPAPSSSEEALAELRLLHSQTKAVLQQRLEEHEALVVKLLGQCRSPGQRRAANEDSQNSACWHQGPSTVFTASDPSNDAMPTRLESVDRQSLESLAQFSSFKHTFSTGHRYSMPSRFHGSGSFDMKDMLGGFCRCQGPEQQRSGVLGAVVESHMFHFLCAAVILVNCVTAIVMAERQVRELSDPPLWVATFDHTFLAFYTLELLLKLVVYRLDFFVGKDRGSNIFDLAIVGLDLISTALHLISESGGIDLTFLRSLRIFKITRVLRLLRAFDIFVELKLLLLTITGSFFSLVWCALVVLFTLLLFALLFIQIVSEFLMDNPDLPCDDNACLKRSLLDSFGSLGSAMMTLYMSTTGGQDWIVYYAMLSETGGVASAAFVLFTFTYEFGMFNLLTSMFVERTTKTGMPDRDAKVLQQRSLENKQTAELLALFAECDVDRDGKITLEEFRRLMKNSTISSYLASIGLEIVDACTFFQLMVASFTAQGSATPSVPVEEFVQSCMRMKGQATSIDMQILWYQHRLLGDKVRRLTDSVKGLSTNGVRELARREEPSDAHPAFESL